MQLALKVMPPRSLILLDEASVDLDILGREALLAFLKAESVRRGVTVLYCTHIFDGLESWGTELVFVTNGAISSATPFPDLIAQGARANNVPGTYLYRAIQERLYYEYNNSILAANTDGEEVGARVGGQGETGRGAAGAELPSGWLYRQSQGIYGAFGSHKWEAQEKISSER